MMSWAFPKEKFATGYILDSDDYNQNFLSYTQQINGGLNEHNWVDSAMNRMLEFGLVEDDVIARVFSEKTKKDPLSAVATHFEVPQATRWNRVTGTAVTFTSRGGLVWVIASFQCKLQNTPNDQSGLNFALEMDGMTSMGSLLGTGDGSNDYMDRGAGVIESGGIPAGTTPTYIYGSSPSVRARFAPIVVDGLFRVTPGEHTAYLVARNLFTAPAVYQYISQREMIAIDMWA